MADPSFDLEAYLARLGLSRAGRRLSLAEQGAPVQRAGAGSRGADPEANLEGLQVLQEAHCAAIPFENLDLHLGRPISLDMGSLQAKLVAGGRGGYCYEQNTLLAAALDALGFRITRLAARVRANTTETRPRTHMLLRVELAPGAFLADAGFGGDGPIVPVPLEPEGEVWTGGTAGAAGAVGHRVVRELDAIGTGGDDRGPRGAGGGPSGGSWTGLRVLQVNHGGAGWTDLYAFTSEPQIAVDYEMANHFTSTYPRSPFVLNLTAQRARRSRRAILRNRDLTVREGGTITSSTVRDPEHLLDILATEFGLVFAPGTRFAKPEF